jgi:hypothetical protein
MVAQIRIDYAFTLVLCSQVSPLRTETPFSYGPAGKRAGSCRPPHLARRRCPAFGGYRVLRDSRNVTAG